MACRRADLPSSTAHRIVDELVLAGLLERDDENRVRLGLRLWELALRGSVALRLRQAALPFMEHVQARVREHTQLAVLEQDEARRRGVQRKAPGSIEAVSTGVAVPIRDAGEVVAALSVVLPRETDPESAIQALREAAAGIEADLRADRR